MGIIDCRFHGVFCSRWRGGLVAAYRLLFFEASNWSFAMKRKLALLLILFSLLLTSCNTTQKQAEKITFGVDVTTMADATVFVAEAKGFWNAEGLTVEVKPFVSGRLALDALVGKGVDAATAADIAVLLAAFHQYQVRIVATFSTSDKHIAMLGRRDHGVLNPSDLRRKKIGVPVGTSAEYVMDGFLQRSGIPRSMVTVVNLTPPDTVGAIVRGDVDVIFTWQPHIYNAMNQLKSQAVVFPSGAIYNQPFNVVIFPEHKDTIAKLVTGLDQAVKFMRDNRKESIEIVSKRLGLSSAVVESLWDQYSFTMDTKVVTADTLKQEANWVRNTGIVPKNTPDPDYSSLIDFYQVVVK